MTEQTRQELLAQVTRRECLVAQCSNHEHEGAFTGAFCTPCWHMITTGLVGPSDNFIARMTERHRKTEAAYIQQGQKLQDWRTAAEGLLKDIAAGLLSSPANAAANFLGGANAGGSSELQEARAALAYYKGLVEQIANLTEPPHYIK